MTQLQIPLNTWWRRMALLLPALMISAYVSAQAYGPLVAAWIARADISDPAKYERALQHDSGNADYHFNLAQIYHLSASHQNVERALAHYEAATLINPRRSGHWLWLSKLLEQEGHDTSSRDAMARGLEADPNNAAIHWAAANLHVRLGDLDSADGELARTVTLDSSYLPQVLDLAWRLYADPVQIMETHIPNTQEAQLTALRYFVSNEVEAGATLAWNGLRTFDTGPRERLSYVEYLIRLGRPEDAYAVFAEDGAYASAFYNGSFEQELINGGFDWRFSAEGPATVRRDSTMASEGQASLRVEFSSDENPDFYGPWHWLVVGAGQPYALKFSIRTEAVSTDEGIYVEVDGQRSDAVLGTTFWKDFAIPFVASSDLVRVRIRRDPTRKFDNKFNGRVWLDNFHLTKSPDRVAFR